MGGTEEAVEEKDLPDVEILMCWTLNVPREGMDMEHGEQRGRGGWWSEREGRKKVEVNEELGMNAG